MHPGGSSRAAFLAAMLGSSVALAAGGEVRPRAAQDLACPEKQVKVQDWGAKVEARGCGRNAEYERNAGGLDLVMVELQVTPEMRRRAAADLECSSGGIELTRSFTKELGDQLGGSGCKHEVSYDVENGTTLKLKQLTSPAPASVVAKVAKDLNCPGSVEVTLTRDGSGVTTAGAYDCTAERRFYKYSLEPFQRLVERDSTSTVVTADTSKHSESIPEGDVAEVARVQALKERAAKDLACTDPSGVTVTFTKSAIKSGQGVDEDIQMMEAKGCGRRAKYERMASSGLGLTYIEKVMKPEWKSVVAGEMGCAVDKLEFHLYAFPAKGGPDTLGVSGCDKQGSYQVTGAGPKLVYQLGKVPADVVQKIASDLGCLPADVHAELIRRNAKDPWAATGSCNDGKKSMFNLDPFRRIGRAPE